MSLHNGFYCNLLDFVCLWLFSALLRMAITNVYLRPSKTEPIGAAALIRYEITSCGVENGEVILALSEIEDIHLPASELALIPIVFQEYGHTTSLA